jgi:hypothetical protein
MAIKIRNASAFLVTGMFLAPPVLGAEPTEEMRTFARMFAALEARDLKGYCAAMHGEPYVGYLNRVCESAVQNKVKKPEDCLQESILQQVKIDNGKCLAMPATDFEKTALRGGEGTKAFITEIKTQGVDGDALIQQERAKRR